MMVYAVANACIGATPAAYAADVMPQSVSGFGLGIYRCAGDIGAHPSCPCFSAVCDEVFPGAAVCHPSVRPHHWKLDAEASLELYDTAWLARGRPV